MRKDFKIGLIVGLVILFAGLFWLSTRTVLSPEQKLAQSHQQALKERRSTPPLPVSPNSTPPAPIEPEDTTTALVVAEPVQASLAEKKASPPTPPADPRPVSPPRSHVVQSGETLSEIAYHYYGSYTQWRKIQSANPDLLANPNKLKVGMKLIIPD